MLDIDTLHRRARRVLPTAIHTSGLVVDDASPAGLARLLLPLRRKGGGALAFRLSPASLAQLRGDALGWLQSATRARQALLRCAEPFDYHPWQRLQSACGAVYATRSRDGSASLLILPFAGLALYLWQARCKRASGAD